jgi:hypothetical protein
VDAKLPTLQPRILVRAGALLHTQQKRSVFHSVMMCDRSRLPIPKKKGLRKALHIPPQFGDLLISRAFSTLEKKERERWRTALCLVMAENAEQATRRPLSRALLLCRPVQKKSCGRGCPCSLFVPWRRGAQQDNDEEAPEWDRLQSAFWVSARFPILLDLGSEFTRISRNK